MFEKIKQFASKFTKFPIKGKVGVTFDENTFFKNPPTKAQKEKAFSSTNVSYQVKNKSEVGGFEVDGLSIRDGKKVMKLRHIETAEVFSFPINLFELLFEIEPRKK